MSEQPEPKQPEPEPSQPEPSQPEPSQPELSEPEPSEAKPSEPEPSAIVTGTDANADQASRAWTGRALGPLSNLLPGGSVDASADNATAEQPGPAAPASDQDDRAEVSEAEVSEAEVSEAEVAGEKREEGAAAPAGLASAGLAGTDDRWHNVLVGFVDDPRGSVEAARALIDVDIAGHIALLTRNKQAMHAAWQGDEEADTEALRKALVRYRDLRRRLADVASAMVT